MIILMHSSKTMRRPSTGHRPTGAPALLDRAQELVDELRALPVARLAKIMAVSPDLAEKTRQQYADWSTDPDAQAPAAESFVGDIYSGLQVDTFTAAQRRYADTHLRILSGLYGILRPFDGIAPYRLEMGYKLPSGNLYAFWGQAIADQLPARGPIVNLAAVEYSRTVTKYVDAARVVTPKFLTADPKTGKPKFVTVHAKIARGAFARWLVTSGAKDLTAFTDIGYRHEPEHGTDREPAFVCTEFGGKGLSIRLT
ncbi:YaaA family protein [Asanoa sp. WMMD1127]|uniref:YaaA family protein n=1 Tax=Asanoa sp. WMMD1127 TaxID=3016107 RepID=UPI002417183C|nr:YaaA family protein [Asanoa sp. WMMD1127]MDG4825726.1 YaaA family protein [Asanoa sp. WMMD1127]